MLCTTYMVFVKTQKLPAIDESLYVCTCVVRVYSTVRTTVPVRPYYYLYYYSINGVWSTRNLEARRSSHQSIKRTINLFSI